MSDCLYYRYSFMYPNKDDCSDEILDFIQQYKNIKSSILLHLRTFKTPIKI